MVHFLSAHYNTLGVGAGSLTPGIVMRVMFLFLFYKVYEKLIPGNCGGEYIEPGIDSSRRVEM
jgi:hypothetical protein